MDSSALKNEFLVESFENLSSINEDLTRIEKDPQNKELLNKVYRTIHTMKGSASFLGYKSLQDITHCAENLLDDLREGKFNINADIIDALLNTFDICYKILKNIEDIDSEGDIDIENNKRLLEQLLASGGVLESQAKDVEEQEEVQVEQAVEEEKEVEQPAADKPVEAASDDTAGLSAAALDSLKELIDAGKMSDTVLDELGMEEQAQPVASTPQAVEDIGAEVHDLGPIGDSPREEVVVMSDVAEDNELTAENLVDTLDDEPRKNISDSFVRVNVKILDRIMNIVGELVLNRNQILQFATSNSDHNFSKLSQQLNTITSELQSEVMSTRMQPIGSILGQFERLVRDLSRHNDKKITLKLSGQETELDKTLIEAIKDPLNLRNSLP